jgi:hypothetical protein
MAKVELVHSQETYQVSALHLITKCDLFKNNPDITLTPYQVQSEVSRDDFQDFLSALEGKAVDINDKNYRGLLQLSEEFGFQEFLMKISNRRRLPTLPDAQRVKYLSHMLSLEEQVGQHEHQLAALQSMLLAVVRRFETDLARLGSELQAVHDTKNSEAAATHRRSRKESQPAASPPAAPAKSAPAAVPPTAPAKHSPAALPSVPAQPAPLNSRIARDYPPLFEEFRTKRWVLLWRGSRDGFTARNFHRLCDGHANTLTLILDTDGNVFGGFTPAKCESSTSSKLKGDDTLWSFLFTLRNPHGVPPRKFALKKEKKRNAIYCSSRCCAGFGQSYYGGCNILVDDHCNTNNNSSAHFGTRWQEYMMAYANDTQFQYFFTGAREFTVKEIEVFEIKD